MGKCTAPKWFGFRQWFEARFDSLCAEHDIQYTRGCPYLKFRSDIVMTIKMWERGYPVMAAFTLIYNLSFGTIYWVYKRLNDLRKRLF